MRVLIDICTAARMLKIASACKRQNLKSFVLAYISWDKETLHAVKDTREFDELDREMVLDVLECCFKPSRKRQRADDQDREFPGGQDWSRLSNAQLRRACAE